MMKQIETAESGSHGNLDILPKECELMKYIQGNGCLSLDNNYEPPEIKWKSNWSNERKQSVNTENKLKFEQGKKKIDQPNQTHDKYTNRLTVSNELSGLEITGVENDNENTKLNFLSKKESSVKSKKHMLYLARIEYLQGVAEEDGYVLNGASKINFEQFILSEPNIRKGNLILMENGNLRATWTDDKRNRIGLQFIGMQMIQYLIFKHRPYEKLVSRSLGRDSFNGIKQLIEAFDLKSLFYE